LIAIYLRKKTLLELKLRWKNYIDINRRKVGCVDGEHGNKTSRCIKKHETSQTPTNFPRKTLNHEVI
jgi:hypothetical protein